MLINMLNIVVGGFGVAYGLKLLDSNNGSSKLKNMFSQLVIFISLLSGCMNLESVVKMFMFKVYTGSHEIELTMFTLMSTVLTVVAVCNIIKNTIKASRGVE